MYHVCMQYFNDKLEVNLLENGFYIVQKLRKCPYVKCSNSFFDQSMKHRLTKVIPLKFPSNFASKESLCFKNNSFEMFTFFRRDLSYSCLEL